MSCCSTTPRGEKPGADWARAAEAIQLAAIAVFLLLNTLGYLPWSFWLDASGFPSFFSPPKRIERIETTLILSKTTD